MSHPIHIAKDAGLTTLSQAAAIVYLAQCAQRCKALACSLGVSYASVTHITDRLVDLELVETSTDYQTDRRETWWKLTPKGEALARQLLYPCSPATTATASSC